MDSSVPRALDALASAGPGRPQDGAAVAALALTACTPASGSEGSGSAGESGAEATTTSASEQPSRIVAVSSDVSDMALLLAGPERMAPVSESSRSPHMGMLPDLARQVEATIPAGVEPDVEQILSHSPDLVLTTARHAGERTAGDQLADAGVESLALSSDDFASPEAYADALLRVGEALGEEDEATKQADALLEGIREGDESTAQPSEGQQTDGRHAEAAQTAAAEAGLTGTAPLDAELLVRADPDIILLEDFMGAGDEPFDELLGAEAVQQVPAVASGEVHIVPMTEASAVAGIHLPDGYRTVAGIVSGASAGD
ncbi:ABC transporter substrate-binding protein [Brevibacterium senegalense]|uniref:ABC transporter substrate-binding protein n=1 Tax=Brevibacterium senegalense TaxID=1033736 RepID=UPI0013758101|nr:ABC transporter substrate-binding protein [Brevibacterium senegalense]